MTRAVCIICGTQKVGAWTPCHNCRFQPDTVLELVTAVAFSESGQYRSQLQRLPDFVHQQARALEGDERPFSFDMSLIPQIQEGLENPSFRDILTLKRSAKDGLFSKNLNMHEIGPDGYSAHVIKRGRDIRRAAFDSIRRVGDGDLYVTVAYERGLRRQTVVPKDRWYALYDLMTLTNREATERPLLQQVYEGICADFIEKYLEHGNIVPVQ